MLFDSKGKFSLLEIKYKLNIDDDLIDSALITLLKSNLII